MFWRKEYIYRDQYEFASSNQHGDRFKRKGNNKISVAVIGASTSNAAEMKDLILMSHTLDVPVRFNSISGRAYIRVVAEESI